MPPSPFQSLPAELRLRIYELVLTQHPPTFSITFKNKNNTITTNDKPIPTPPTPPNHLALTLLTHQIRTESLPLLPTLHTLHLRIPYLTQTIPLLPTGQPHNPTDLTLPLTLLRTWLSWSGPRARLAPITLHLGVWYTWWQRASAEEIVFPGLQKLLDVVREGNHRPRARLLVVVEMTVEWCAAVPLTRTTGFEVRLPLLPEEEGGLAEARRNVAEGVARKERWIERQRTQDCLRENLATCRGKFERLFELLEEEGGGRDGGESL